MPTMSSSKVRPRHARDLGKRGRRWSLRACRRRHVASKCTAARAFGASAVQRARAAHRMSFCTMRVSAAECTEAVSFHSVGTMAELLSIDQAAQRCSVSRDTIKRRLRAGRLPGAVRGTPVGRRPAPWLIPDEDLVAEGLLTGRRLDGTPPPEPGDDDDPGALRAALVHYQALAAARGAHLEDLRSEIRRLHERMDQLVSALSASCAPAGRDGAGAAAPKKTAPTGPAPTGGRA